MGVSLFLMINLIVNSVVRQKESNFIWISKWIISTIILAFYRFTPIMLIAFFMTLFVCSLSESKFKGWFKVGYGLLPVFSILIYSFFVDVLCYWFMPKWVGNLSLMQYVINGFIFNSKYVLSNSIIFGTVSGITRFCGLICHIPKSLKKIKCIEIIHSENSKKI